VNGPVLESGVVCVVCDGVSDSLARLLIGIDEGGGGWFGLVGARTGSVFIVFSINIQI
jgi:hypothetical protein